MANEHIINHQVNENQNHSEVPFVLTKVARLKKRQRAGRGTQAVSVRS
jgi:hypothetical protein